ncbi:hypoxanthine phosphoribosyltransferase, partial [Candidatus Hakubella thermalkaliphila]
MEEEAGEVLISREQIEKRTRELGEEISRDYKGKDLVCVAILRGGFIFIADLCRKKNSSPNMIRKGRRVE